MADVLNLITTAEGGSFKARFEALRAEWRARAARRSVYRRTVVELQALSDRELADFGFHRTEIPRIAREAAADL